MTDYLSQLKPEAAKAIRDRCAMSFYAGWINERTIDRTAAELLERHAQELARQLLRVYPDMLVSGKESNS